MAEPAFNPAADSLGAAKSFTSPGASSVLATLTPPAGKYRVQAVVFLSGTAETSLQNIRLSYNGATMVDTIPSISGAAPVVINLPQVTLDGVNPLKLTSIGAAVAGAVYNAVLVATRIA